MSFRQVTRTAITRAPALAQPRIALATRPYADLGSPHPGPAGVPPPRHPADAPRDAPPGTPRPPPPPRSDGSGTMLMVGGGVALAGIMYYAFSTDKSSVKGKAKELEGRAKGKAHEVTGEVKRGYDETVGEAKRAVK